MTDEGVDRIPPNDLEAERAVLGSMLIDADAVTVCGEMLTARDFYPLKHRIAFDAIMALADRHEAVDMLTVRHELQERGNLEKFGDASALLDLSNCVPSAAHVEEYANVVKQYAVRRAMVRMGTRLVHSGFRSDEETPALLADAERELFSLSESNGPHEPKPVRNIIGQALQELEEMTQNPDRNIWGAPTDYPDLDNVVGGCRDGEIIVIGGRPGAGKTSLAVNIALRFALRGDPVAIFSLEMSEMELTRRMLSIQSRVVFQKQDGLYLSDEEWQNVLAAGDEMAGTNIFIDDSSALKLRTLKTRARRLAHAQGVKLLIVDYLQLVQGTRGENRQQDVAEISRDLKALAGEIGAPILALSQLNREASKERRHPSMADLRESGAIEQDADVILLLSPEDDTDPNADTTTTRVNVAKNRNGRTGRVHLTFRRDRMRFESCAFGSETNCDGPEMPHGGMPAGDN